MLPLLFLIDRTSHFCDTVKENKNIKKGRIGKNHEYFMKTRNIKNKDNFRKTKKINEQQNLIQ